MDSLANKAHDHQNALPKEHRGDFTPLLVIFITVILFTLLRQLYFGVDFDRGMYDFMGSFFFIVGLFKVIKLTDFADAYSTYDIIAKRFIAYAYLYPFIELALGAMYLTNFMPILANLIALSLMIVSSIGVALELQKKSPMQCACLGTVFKVPMTKVTLFEDILMASMALIMILR